MKFLIDENLSPELADLVDNAVHQCVPVKYRKLGGKDDDEIMEKVLAEDWTFVTNNSKHFQPLPGSKSTGRRYQGVELHAGLICLNTPPNMPKGIGREIQKKYFKAALQSIPGDPPDMTNMIMVVEPDPDQPDPLTGNAVVEVYEHPEDR